MIGRLSILSFVVFSLFSLFRLFPYRKRNALFLFVAFNIYFSLGTAWNLDFRLEADLFHAYVLAIGSFSICIYSLLFFSPKRYADIEESFRIRKLRAANEPVTALLFLLVFSVLVVLFYYYYLVGYNLFYLSLSGGEEDFVSMRLASYSAGSYKGAGIVNQFKNTILPICYFSFFFVLRGAGRRMLSVLFVLSVFPFYVWAILGTGQRTFLVLTLVGLFLYLYHEDIRISFFWASVSLVVFVVLFSVTSLSQGRMDDLSMSSVIDQLLSRVMDDNQIGTVVGFRYVYEKDTVYGAEWMKTLVGFLPGVRGSTLANEVFAVIYGGYRGTVPVSMWTSIFHNFGLWGVAPVGLVIMWIVDRVHSLLTIMPATRSHLMTYSFLCMYFMFMPVSNPFQIINNGILAIALFYICAGIRVNGLKLYFVKR